MLRNDENVNCDTQVDEFRTGTLDIIGAGGSILDMYAQGGVGWTNQIRFWESCERGGLQHIIASHQESGHLVIHPGYGGNASKFLEIQGKAVIGTGDVPEVLPGSGESLSDYKFFVDGGILANEVRVATGWGDFVFYDDYQLRSLPEVQSFIDKNGYLPDMHSAAEVESDGVEVGDITLRQQIKIEELF